MSMPLNVGDADRSPVDIAAQTDPVAVFWHAHRRGRRVLVHTSGTTGQPRTIVRSTASWVDSFGLVAARLGLTPQSRFHIPGPLSATMNLFAACLAEFSGAAWSRNPDGATHCTLTPSGLARRLAGTRPPVGQVVLVAGDGLGSRLRDEAHERGCRVEHYYGATELSLVAWGSCRDDLRLFDLVEARILDDRIWVRSPWLSDGPAPGSPVGPWRFQDDGFASIGDRGLLEGDRLCVIGREGSITTGGVTVELAPLRARLQNLAAGEVHLVGIPHPVVGEVLGCALSRPDDAQRLRSWAQANLAPAERPRAWAVIEHLPLTAAGKLDTAALAILIRGQRTAPKDDHHD